MSEKDDISKELEAMEDDKGSDDYFEKVLETELDLPTDDDASADSSDKKVADGPKDDDKAKKEDDDPAAQLKAANDRIAELEKEAKGRLSDTVKSRQEKRMMKEELTELKSAVSSLLAKRDNAADGEKDEKKSPLDETKMGVEFDDDDKAFVDLKPVKEKIEEETKKTRAELDELKAERDAAARKEAFKRAANEIISEDADSFDPAFPVLQEAFKDLNDAVIAMQERLEVWDAEDGSIDQDRALDLLQGTEELKAFEEKHPGIDPIKVARAFNTKVDFRTSLRNIADVKEFGKADNDADAKDSEAKLDDKIKAAKDKPGSLAGASDQAGGTADLIARIATLDTEEIVNMSDAEAERIEAMLEREARGD
jgi:hypothetical protein